ncbi:8372_t:CDS:2 [Paraglomus occultum]|uniref:8372_t:CDS:1 n=1 Tax=Paraglomus occultum TaxID=144539 RepID=A0A9N9FMT5_9GLOM|nr:8372_t:CDS:2 [Paraglomus occultum]
MLQALRTPKESSKKYCVCDSPRRLQRRLILSSPLSLNVLPRCAGIDASTSRRFLLSPRLGIQVSFYTTRTWFRMSTSFITKSLVRNRYRGVFVRLYDNRPVLNRIVDRPSEQYQDAKPSLSRAVHLVALPPESFQQISSVNLVQLHLEDDDKPTKKRSHLEAKIAIRNSIDNGHEIREAR